MLTVPWYIPGRITVVPTFGTKVLSPSLGISWIVVRPAPLIPMFFLRRFPHYWNIAQRLCLVFLMLHIPLSTSDKTKWWEIPATTVDRLKIICFQFHHYNTLIHLIQNGSLLRMTNYTLWKLNYFRFLLINSRATMIHNVTKRLKWEMYTPKLQIQVLMPHTTE